MNDEKPKTSYRLVLETEDVEAFDLLYQFFQNPHDRDWSAESLIALAVDKITTIETRARRKVR